MEHQALAQPRAAPVKLLFEIRMVVSEVGTFQYEEIDPEMRLSLRFKETSLHVVQVGGEVKL